MTTIYIDPTSPTNGSGTLTNPRNTWAGVTWTAGNTYLQRAGTTFTSSGTSGFTVTSGGSAGNRITIGSYEPGTGRQTTARAKISGGTRWGIQLGSGVTHVTIQDMEIVNVGNAENTCHGITWVAASDTTDVSVIVQRCEVHDLVPGPSDWVPAVPKDCNGISGRGSNNIIQDNLVYNIPNDGIFIRGTNLTVQRNTVYNINMDGADEADCFQATGNYSGLVVQDNYFDGSNGDGKQVIILGAETTPGTNHIIRRNIIIGGADSQQGIFSGVDVLVEGNIIYNCIHGMRLNAAGCVVRSNIIINELTTALGYKSIWLEVDGSTVVNNTIVNLQSNKSDSAGLFLDPNDDGHTVRNNIFVGLFRGIRLSGTDLQQETFNVFWGNNRDIEEDGNVIPINSTSRNVDPLFDPRWKPTNLVLASAGDAVSGTDYYGEPFVTNVVGAVSMGKPSFTSMLKTTEAKGNAEDFHGR